MQEIGQSHSAKCGGGLRVSAWRRRRVDAAGLFGAALGRPQAIGQCYEIEIISGESFDTTRVGSSMGRATPTLFGSQGIEQARSESMVQDEDDTWLTGSFIDDAMLCNDDGPMMNFDAKGSKRPHSPSGIRGSCEVGAFAAVTNTTPRAHRGQHIQKAHKPFTASRIQKELHDHGTA